MAARFFSAAFLFSLASAIVLQGHIGEREPEAYFLSIINPGPDTVNVSAYYNFFDNSYQHPNNPLTVLDSAGNNLAADFIYPVAPSGGAGADSLLTLRPNTPFMREIVLQQFTVNAEAQPSRQQAVQILMPTHVAGVDLATGKACKFRIAAAPYNSTVTLPASRPGRRSERAFKA